MDSPQIYVAESWSQFRSIRTIRNECRYSMTHDQEEIGFWQQVGFWLYHKQMGYRAYLIKVGKEAIAYGLIRKDATGFDWISGGVKESARGQGYGRLLFSFLTQVASKPAYLDVFWENTRARHLYQRLGWFPLDRVDAALGTIIVMVHD